MDQTNPEDRVIELEERLAFQEHTLTQLNAVIVDHGRRIEELQRALRQVHRQLEGVVAGLQDEDPNQAPPHY